MFVAPHLFARRRSPLLVFIFPPPHVSLCCHFVPLFSFSFSLLLSRFYFRTSSLLFPSFVRCFWDLHPHFPLIYIHPLCVILLFCVAKHPPPFLPSLIRRDVRSRRASPPSSPRLLFLFSFFPPPRYPPVPFTVKALPYAVVLVHSHRAQSAPNI